MQHNIVALPHGTRLQNGKYAVAQVMGQGGFGLTYRGGNLVDKCYVAIQEYIPAAATRQGTALLTSTTTDERQIQAKDDFLRVAKLLAGCEDAGIVRVLDGFEENNTAYMVMEFLEGQTLGDRIANKGKMDEWDAVDIGVRLSRALEIIHNAGISHRNIKPDNVLITRTGRAVLIDFATASASDGVNASLQQHAAHDKLSPATDIYGLGATLYYALSGIHPVVASERGADVQVEDLKTLAPQLSPFVAKVIMQALNVDAAKRPQSAQEFAARLRGQPFTPPINSYSSAPKPVGDNSGIEGGEGQAARLTLLHNKLDRHTSTVNAIAFSPDGIKLASAGLDKVVNIWSWNGAAISAFIRANEIAVNALSYSPDGAWLATGGRDQKVFILDATMQNRVPLAILNDCKGVVNNVRFCPTRRELLVGDEGALTLWDTVAGTIKARIEKGCLASAWSPDGNLIATGDMVDKTLYLLDGLSLEVISQFPVPQGTVTDLAFSPNGRRLAICSTDGTIQVWNIPLGTLVWEQRPANVPATCVAWSPDGRLIAVGCRDIVFLWTEEGELWRQYMKHKDTIRDIAFAPSPPAPFQYVVASSSRDKTINLCRIKSGDAS